MDRLRGGGLFDPKRQGTNRQDEGSELPDIETPTQNNAIRVLAYTGHKWIVDPDLIKVQLDWHICNHENTWLRKVSWGPLQWTWCDPYVGKEVKPSLPSNLRLDWVARFQPLNPPESLLPQRVGTHTMFLTQLSTSFDRKSGNNNRPNKLPSSNGY